MIPSAPKPQITVSLTLASLVLCYGYSVKIEGRTPWSEGLIEFLGIWLASYFFMLIFFLAVATVYLSTFNILAEQNQLKPDVFSDEIIVFFGVVVFTACVIITFVI